MPAPLSLDLRERVTRRYLEGGITISKVAQQFGVGEATAKRWIWRARSGEGLEPRPSPGRPREFTSEHDALLERLVAERPDRSIAELTDIVGEECGRGKGRSRPGV